MENQMEGWGIFIVVISVIGGIALVIAGIVEEFYWLIALGIGLAINGVIICTLFGAGAEVIRLLKKLNGLEYGGAISAPPKEAIWYTVKCNEIDTAMKLIEEGQDVNAIDMNRNTALHFASKIDNLPLVKCLISKGADVNARNIYGETPLHSAFYSDIDIVPNIKCLVNNGADINAQDNRNETPLALAVRSNNKEAAEFLRQQGAKE